MEKEAEQRILAQAIAKDDAAKIKETSIGYSISLIMDYGNGRQVTIAGCLPLNATKEQFDAELDKLRLATNRQQAYVIMRDRESRLIAERKMVAALDLMIEQYTKTAEEEMKRLGEGETKNHTLVKQQIANMKAQVVNQTQLKRDERERHQSEVEIAEAIIAQCKKEIEGK